MLSGYRITFYHKPTYNMNSKYFWKKILQCKGNNSKEHFTNCITLNLKFSVVFVMSDQTIDLAHIKQCLFCLDFLKIIFFFIHLIKTVEQYGVNGVITSRTQKKEYTEKFNLSSSYSS